MALSELAFYLTPPRSDVLHSRKKRERMHERLRAELSIDTLPDKAERKIERRRNFASD